MTGQHRKHGLWVESKTHSGGWKQYFCYCGHRVPTEDPKDFRMQKAQEAAVIAHIEEATGKPYEPEPGLVGPPPKIGESQND